MEYIWFSFARLQRESWECYRCWLY